MANSPTDMDRISDIEAILQRLAALTEGLKSDVGILKSDVGILKSDVGILKSDVGILKSDNRDIKQAIWRLTELAADHSERFTALEKSQDLRFQAVNERLDRLVAMGMRERTESIERLARIEQTANEERLGSIERRLTRLEERD